VRSEECWYIGDDLRDIQAAEAAGMTSIAAAWGIAERLNRNTGKPMRLWTVRWNYWN
jgi:phosphoglycolate phosphatase-like HAD superfamily hydrolase